MSRTDHNNGMFLSFCSNTPDSKHHLVVSRWSADYLNQGNILDVQIGKTFWILNVIAPFADYDWISHKTSAQNTHCWSVADQNGRKHSPMLDSEISRHRWTNSLETTLLATRGIKQQKLWARLETGLLSQFHVSKHKFLIILDRTSALQTVVQLLKQAKSLPADDDTLWSWFRIYYNIFIYQNSYLFWCFPQQKHTTYGSNSPFRAVSSSLHMDV